MLPIEDTVEHQIEIARIKDFLDALDDEVVLVNSEGYIVSANEAWDKFCNENDGDAISCSVGSNYIEVCTSAVGASSAEARIIPGGFAKTLKTGETFRCEYPCDSPTEKRWFELTANRFNIGGSNYLTVQHRNITKRRIETAEVEQAFLNSNAMAALVATTSDAILSYDLDGSIITWNRSAEKLYGYTEVEALGQSLEILYPENWPKRLTYYRDEILAGRLRHFEATRVAKDGAEREVWISCAPIRSMSGEIVAISNIHRDITDVRNAERARDLVANEVIHRAKNMLSVVTAIQRQTARSADTIADFTRSFEARLASLSRSTDMLIHNAWTSVSLKDLVTGHLEPFVIVSADQRVKISGPRIDVQPECVQTVGMAIHELATNSAKYGTLKQDQGQIEISWSVDAGDGTLDFTWSETGIEAAISPTRKGFGNTVLTTHAQTMLAAETSYELNSDAVLWTIKIPPSHFQER